MLVLNVRTNHDVVAVIDPASQSPVAPLFHRDFPDYQLPVGAGHDGEWFYALAREPMHIHDASAYVDRPRYRFQRVLLPVLAWILHPQGGGRGLAVAMWIVAAFGVWLMGFGGAMLAHALRAPPHRVEVVAVLCPLLPATFSTLDLTVADTLALGLVVSAIALDAFGYRKSALATAILAVLAKEVMVLVLLGWILRPGGRGSMRMFTIPLAVVAAWWLALWAMFPHDNGHSDELTFVRGLTRAVGEWLHGHSAIAAISMLVAVALGIAVLVRDRMQSPLAVAILLQLLVLPCLSPVVLANDWNGPRASGALLLLSVIAISSPRATRASTRESRRVAEPLPRT